MEGEDIGVEEETKKEEKMEDREGTGEEEKNEEKMEEDQKKTE